MLWMHEAMRMQQMAGTRREWRHGKKTWDCLEEEKGAEFERTGGAPAQYADEIACPSMAVKLRIFIAVSGTLCSMEEKLTVSSIQKGALFRI